MNKIKKFLLTFLILFFIICLFKYSYLLQNTIIIGVNLWLTKVFPSLFIMFIINDLIINLDLFNNIKLFNKLFNISGSSTNAFLLSIISGTPTSTFIIKEMLNSNKITINDANKLITYTYFSNPLFLYTILSLSFNKFITIKIIIIHYISNIIIALIYRNKYKNIDVFINNNSNNKNNLFLLLPHSIKKSLDILLMILGTIIFYMIITNIIIEIFPINNLLEILFKGFLEITQSLNLLSNFKYISIIKEIIAISIISFGGLSIHTQVLSIINNTKISYKNFLFGRILHVLISTLTYLFFYFTIPC